MNNIDFRSVGVEAFAGKKFECACGKTHEVTTESIRIGGNMEEQLGGLVSKILPAGSLLFVTQEDVYESHARVLERALNKTHLVTRHMLPSNYRPELRDAGKLLQAGEEIRLVVSYGGGSVTDLAKYYASLVKIPHIAVASSPATDGYLSPYAELFVGKKKEQLLAKAPEHFLFDINAAVSAPPHMRAAGLGCILGKLLALLDWSFAFSIKNQAYCENVARFTQQIIVDTLEVAEGLNKGNHESILCLCENLTRSSIAKLLMGCERGAIGGEHQLSLALEMCLRHKELDNRHATNFFKSISALPELKDSEGVNPILPLSTSYKSAILQKDEPNLGSKGEVKERENEVGAVDMSDVKNGEFAGMERVVLQGELCFLGALMLVKIYHAFFESEIADLALPPDYAKRAEKLYAYFGLEQKSFLEQKRQLSEDKLLLFKLREYRADFLRFSVDVEKKLENGSVWFKRMYADAGFWIENFLPRDVLGKALAFAPELSNEYTLLTLLRDVGLLDTEL